jgi:hypothetical protein
MKEKMGRTGNNKKDEKKSTIMKGRLLPDALGLKGLGKENSHNV